MSGTKDWKEEQADARQWAVDALCEAVAVQECRVHHGEYFRGKTDIGEASDIVARRASSGEIAMPRGIAEDDLKDLLAEVHSEYADVPSCPYCERYLRKG